MSQFQYNSLMSGLFNQKYTFAKLRTELEERKERICQCCKKFGHLVHNCRNKKKEMKEKPILQNKFEVIASRVIQCEVREKVKVRRQKIVEKKEVRYFKFWRIEHYK